MFIAENEIKTTRTFTITSSALHKHCVLGFISIPLGDYPGTCMQGDKTANRFQV